MKTKIYSIDGKAGKEIELPKCFSKKVREDIVCKVLETQKKMQPYSCSPIAGRQQKAQGKVVHRRHVWRSGYGAGMSRVPRKIFSRRGTRFNWQAAEIPSTVGGRRAHPPKNKISDLKINKKELRIALESALSATANPKMISKKYTSLKTEIKQAPFVIDFKFDKAKQFKDGLKKILGEDVFEIAIPKKRIRAGKGKMRGRKYKKSAGMLLVVGQKENPKLNGIEVNKAKFVSVTDLAKGGVGRLVVYTENAIKEMGERIK